MTPDRKIVDECYAKGFEAGGKDNGAPRVRDEYKAGYYAAFLLDPAGNGVEIMNRAET